MTIPSITDFLEKLKTNSKVEEFGHVLENHSFWSRHLFLGDIDAEVGDSIESMIRFWNMVDDDQKVPVDDRQPIKIYVNSGGGDLSATLSIIDAINMSRTPVWAINTGCAYSGGFFIFIAAHKRFSYKHSSFLYHEGSVQNGGTAIQFRNFSDFYEKQLAQLKAHVLKRTKISEELYESKKKDDWWLNADEALELGVCDEIVEGFV